MNWVFFLIRRQGPAPSLIPMFISLDNYIVTGIQSEWNGLNDSVARGSGRPLICPDQALGASNMTINLPGLPKA